MLTVVVPEQGGCRGLEARPAAGHRHEGFVLRESGALWRIELEDAGDARTRGGQGDHRGACLRLHARQTGTVGEDVELRAQPAEIQRAVENGPWWDRRRHGARLDNPDVADRVPADRKQQ